MQAVQKGSPNSAKKTPPTRLDIKTQNFLHIRLRLNVPCHAVVLQNKRELQIAERDAHGTNGFAMQRMIVGIITPIYNGLYTPLFFTLVVLGDLESQESKLTDKRQMADQQGIYKIYDLSHVNRRMHVIGISIV